MMLIGVTGYARTGKDTLSRHIKEFFESKGKSVEIFSFAQELKKDLEEFIFSKTGISVWTEDTAEKSIIRPLMVEYGGIQRRLSKGRYWIEKLIPKLESSSADYKIISDCRFSEFENDEADFVKQNGILIHLSRYTADYFYKDYYLPANSTEEANDPRMKAKANFLFEWADFSGKEDQEKKRVFEFLEKNKIK